MGTIVWTKPSGLEIETNDMEETVKYAESLGWKHAGDTPEPEIPAAPEPETYVTPDGIAAKRVWTLPGRRLPFG